MAEAVDEDVAEVVAEITLGIPTKTKMRSLKINLRSPATTIKVRGILPMNVESPRKKERRKTLTRKLIYLRKRKKQLSLWL